MSDADEKQAERCRCCGGWWRGGIVCTTFGARDDDSIRRYCQACVDTGTALLVEEAVDRARREG